MRKLFLEYKRSLRLAKEMRRKIECKEILSEQDKIDKELIGNMISDLEYSIEWLRIGRNPDSRRGIDKQGVYLTDPAILNALHVKPLYSTITRGISNFKKEMIEDALCTLTEREKDVFIMIHAEGLTFDYTAQLLGVKKSTVQTHLERAEKKIQDRKNQSLFLVS
ncbi:sigma factor-like helix-turn-helix DNA-binding protein [Mesobacillus zeae]|uniref:Fis family transcriptional regulator n=1 Tax=Mesobacillus zeae TaxID=1917180 RepID=A0A398B884_9BACI|nr:sigma factor-like helix-turn-helix DNA-binding protein [Mesobacillus zeae]RID85038.1 Fis family transcriptional regulator [Mesobacillus zeae]